MIPNIFKVLTFISLFLAETIILNISGEYAALAVGGSLAGGVALAYFKPSKYWLDRLIKVLLSAVSALFLAPAFIKFYNIESREYTALVFFAMSLISLFVLRALINLTEKNASDVLKNVFIRVTNIEVKDKPPKKRIIESINLTEEK